MTADSKPFRKSSITQHGTYCICLMEEYLAYGGFCIESGKTVL